MDGTIADPGTCTAGARECRTQRQVARIWRRAHRFREGIGRASVYFIRADALANVGKHANAVSDLHTAVGLDPSLAQYVMIRGKTVSLQLPPL